MAGRKRARETTTNPTSLSTPPPSPRSHHHHHHERTSRATGFADLPYDLLGKIASASDAPTLRAAGMVCRAWWEALGPLREATMLLRQGKRFKHGKGGIARDPEKALAFFLRASAKGSAHAMVDAGVMYWKMGKKGEAMKMYGMAAELGEPVGQHNLALAYSQAEPPNHQVALKLFQLAATSGYQRAQYSLALCFQHGRGVSCNLNEAAKWYLKSAEGGNQRAMYNLSLCYSTGEGGIQPNNRLARMWLKRAAHSGHSKAQFELGFLSLQSGKLIKALVYVELAIRAGELAALHMKSYILHRLSQQSIVNALTLADKWRPSLFHS